MKTITVSQSAWSIGVLAFLAGVSFNALSQPAPRSSVNSAASSYPQRPIRWIIAFPPGGGADTIARIVGTKLSEVWNQQVVVDNRPGAGGNLAAILVAKAVPDGYTLMQSTVGHIITQTLDSKVPYNMERDFVAVTQLASTPLILVTNIALPASSTRELVALAKAKPGALTYASSSLGSSSHLAMELFRSAAQIDMRHIPYKGAAPSITDILGGQVDMTFTSIAAVLPLVKAGRLRALGVAGLRRNVSLPSIPTIDEGGLKGFEASTWYGVQVPAATPRAIVNSLQREMARVVREPDITARLAIDGYDAVASTSEEFSAYVRSEIVKWDGAIKKSGMRIE